MVELLEGIQDPACIYLPGGRIVAVNRAVERLAVITPVGMTIGELIDRYQARSGDRNSLVPGELPSTRALRGEILTHGERIDATLPDGSVYRAIVTSIPLIVDGKVVAALSVWHDHSRCLRQLGGESTERGGPSPGHDNGRGADTVDAGSSLEDHP